MKRIIRRSRYLTWLSLPLMILLFGAADQGTAVAAVQLGNVTVQKQLVDAAGAAVAGDLSGYQFVLSSGGNPITLNPTNAQGTTTINVAPGTYTITETPRPGSTLLGFFVGGAQIGNVPVTANQTVNITARNQVLGNATITITKQIVDATGSVVAAADRGGFQFSVAGPNGFAQTITSDTDGTVTISNLAAGTYTVAEQPRTGWTLASMTINGVTVSNGQQFQIAAGGTTSVVANNRQGTANGTIAISKQIVDASGGVVGADRSGFQFTVTCGTTFTQTVTTDVNGSATLTNVPAGTCTVNEASRAGFTLVSITSGGITIGQGGSFTVASGQTTSLTVQNRQGTTTGGTVAITKQIVDANGAVLGSADRSGFQFTVTCGTTFSQTATTDATGAATLTNVPAGSCTVSEASRTGFTLVSITSGGSTVGQGGSFTVTTGQTVTLTAQNRQGTTGQTETVQLSSGCNNISITWPNGTATSVVAQAISPATALIAIWRFDNADKRFTGYSPIPNAPNDLTTVNRIDAVFVCMNAAGSLTRPAI